MAKVYPALKMSFALTPEVLSPSVSGRWKYGKLKRSEEGCADEAQVQFISKPADLSLFSYISELKVLHIAGSQVSIIYLNQLVFCC